MTTTIDNKIVEMAFQNSQFEKNVGTSLSTIDRLKKALNFDHAGKSFDGITASAQRVNMNPIAEGVNSLANRFSAMGIVGIGVLLNLTNSAIEAGKRIARALVIDPIKTGLNEYETKLNSVQTILANTQKEGSTLETVTAALNDLNAYSDKTIYNFQQMARNIGTFTAAGVKLDTSVAAIKGIANLAAISGSNADQASTAMYQLSQALSTGTVRLMDWNSVVNAGMGGQVFQDAVMETARVHGVAIDQIIAEEGSFRDSLQRGWFSSEILTETLQKFTGDLNEQQLKTMGYNEEQIAGILKMGQTAQDAATKVKTFSQLFQTLAEAAQSGWAQTWEIIIGDFEEAKTFLTQMNDFFGGIIGRAADARNELLQGWSDLGGRTQLIKSFENVLNAIVSVINPIREGMREIFPPLTAQNLIKITEAIQNFTSKLIIGGKTADEIKRIFRGVFAIFDIGKMAVLAIAKELGRLLGYLAPVPGGFTAILASVGDFVLKIRDAIKANDTFGRIMRTIGDIILSVAGVIGVGIKAILSAVERFKQLNASEGFLESFKGAIQAFLDFFKNLDFGFISDFIERITARFDPISKLGDLFKKKANEVEKAPNPFIEKLKLIASNIKEAISKFVLDVLDKLSKLDFSKFSFKGMFDTLNAGLLSGLLVAIIKFVNNGTGIFGSIVDVFKGISGFAENANGILSGITTVLTGVREAITTWQQQVRAGILMKIAGSIAILAASLIALSLIDSEKLTFALAAVTGLFANLLGAISIYEKASGTTGIPAMAKGITAMVAMSVAILLLSGALVAISKIPPEDVLKGIVGIAALSAIMIGTSIALSKNEAGVIKGAGSMIIFSLALRALIGPIKQLGAMDTGAMTQGLIGLGVMLTEIGIFMKAMNSSLADLEDVIGLLVLSAAISTLSTVIEQLGALDSTTITQGLTVLGILMAGLASFTKIATGGGLFLLTAAGILVLSHAMTIMADVLKEIGSMSMDQVTVALVGLAGALGILGIAMTAMQGAIMGAAAIVIAAGALAILVPPLKALGNMSLEQVGIALLALAGAFTVLGLAGLILTPVVPTLLGLGVAIALFGVGALAAGVGISALAAGMALLATVGAAGGLAVAAALTAVAAILPLLAAGAALAIIAFARVIKEGVPVIFEAGKALILGFVKSVTETMPEIIEMVMTGISTLLTSIAERTPELVQAGFDILLGFLRGVNDNIKEVVNVSYDIVNAYLGAISERIPELIDSGFNLIISFIDGMTASVEKHMPRLMESTTALGLAIVDGVVNGLMKSSEKARQGIINIGKDIINAFKRTLGIASPSTVFMSLAQDIVTGLLNGLKNFSSNVFNEIRNIGQRMIDNFRGNISSAYNAGRDFVLGLANGIGGYVATAVNKAKELALSVLRKIREVFDARSPARKTIEVGKDVDEGLAIGIDRFAGSVLQSADNLGKDTISKFSQIVADITNAMNTDMNMVPEIRPVLDLSEIQSSSSLIDNMLGGRRLNLAVASVRAASISSTTQPVVDGATQQSGTAPSVIFTQNNYSPKSLPRIEIYRQTKNALSITKQMAGV